MLRENLHAPAPDPAIRVTDGSTHSPLLRDTRFVLLMNIAPDTKMRAEAPPEVLSPYYPERSSGMARKVYIIQFQYPRREASQDMMDLLRQDEEIWDLFTREEEYERSDRDRFDRFPYYKSRHRDVFTPRASQMLMENGFCCEYPESRPFAVCLTHDIDTVYRPLYLKGFDILQALKNGDLARAGHVIPQLHSRKLPAWNFKEIAGLEEAHGARSSFYFLALEEDKREYAYAVEELEQEICTLQDGGWEIGLHGGCEAYRDPDSLKNEKQRLERVLNRKIAGYRNHYLRFRVPETWELLERAGFLYDTTLGYPDCIGFRNGMCHPFRPFNLNSGREMKILEIPLVIMDRTLLSHMRLNGEQAWDQTRHLIDTVERYHGVITILWHNEFMTGTPLRFYRKILEYCHDRGAWMTSGKEIEAWWRKNGMRASRRP